VTGEARLPSVIAAMPHEIDASDWLNTDTPLSLSSFRGRVVAVAVFQMLCEGCARFSLPQARNLHSAFARDDLEVIGMHSVFEHHHAMTPDALRVFVKEYGLQFPVAIDRHEEGSPMPVTMSRWALAGTPTLLVLDRDGQLALQHFGHVDDLRLGALLGGLIARRASQARSGMSAGEGVGGGPVCASTSSLPEDPAS